MIFTIRWEGPKNKRLSFKTNQIRMSIHVSLSFSEPTLHLCLLIETLAKADQAERTVFIGNVPLSVIIDAAARKVFMKHINRASGTSSERIGKCVDSIRFRSVPFSSQKVPKRVAFSKNMLMEDTCRSTNAYVVYDTIANAACAIEELNGTLILGRHIRVDSTVKPRKQDHRLCIFVGNLDFVDGESPEIMAGEGTQFTARNRSKKNRAKVDSEEGLWTLFTSCGTIDSVRIIRDKETRISKGFGYIQFRDPNSVEKALLLNGKSAPPSLPRPLRVMRSKAPVGVRNGQRAESGVLRRLHAKDKTERHRGATKSRRGAMIRGAVNKTVSG